MDFLVEYKHSQQHTHSFAVYTASNRIMYTRRGRSFNAFVCVHVCSVAVQSSNNCQTEDLSQVHAHSRTHMRICAWVCNADDALCCIWIYKTKHSLGVPAAKLGARAFCQNLWNWPNWLAARRRETYYMYVCLHAHPFCTHMRLHVRVFHQGNIGAMFWKLCLPRIESICNVARIAPVEPTSCQDCFQICILE